MLSFASVIASSSVSNGATAATGPKVSSCEISISEVMSASTVGA